MNRVYQVPNRHYVFQRTRAFVVVVAFAILFQLATLAAILPTFVMGREFVTYFQPWLLKTGSGRTLQLWRGDDGGDVPLPVCSTGRYRTPARGSKTSGPEHSPPGYVPRHRPDISVYVRLFSHFNRTATIFGFVSILVFWFYLLAHVFSSGPTSTQPGNATGDAPMCYRSAHRYCQRRTTIHPTGSKAAH